MNTFEKTAIILSLLWAIPVLCPAQSTVHYTYDNAGNRICQEIIYDNLDRMQRFGTMGNRQDDTKGGTISGQVGGHVVRASILSGVLRVEVLGLMPDDRCQLNVYTMSGLLLVSQTATTTQTTLDIGNQTDGVYILQVRINNDKGVWKVIGQ